MILKKALWQCDFDSIQQNVDIVKIQQQLTEQEKEQRELGDGVATTQYLKIIQDHMDIGNIKHRLRLYYNQRFNNAFTRKADQKAKRQEDEAADKHVDQMLDQLAAKQKAGDKVAPEKKKVKPAAPAEPQLKRDASLKNQIGRALKQETEKKQ